MKKLYYGGNIITMAGEKDRPQALVEEEGKIIYVGTVSGARDLYGVEMEPVDLAGKTLMPAFIDPHSHFSQVAQSIGMCDLSETESFEEIQKTLKHYIEVHEIDEDGVVLASGYDHNFLKEGTHPDKQLLDAVSDRVPIYISHASGHMGAANSAILKLAQITDETPDPQGGKFGRYPDGTLNGYVEETPALMQIVMPAMNRVKFDLVKQVEEAQQLYLKNGITTVQEGAAVGQALQMLIGYTMQKPLLLDVVAYILTDDYENTAKQFPNHLKAYQNRIRIGGAKLILDGSPQGKSAWLSKPYQGEEEYRGYATHEDSYVDQAVLKAVEGGYQILAHCNGDAASEQFLNSVEKAYQQVKGADQKDLRPVMIHCQTVREDQLQRMKKLSMVPSIFVGHTYYWGDIHLKNLGEERGSKISPVRTAKELGLCYNFHQDSPVTKPDMLHSVWCAVNRMTRRGRVIGKEECIDVYDALKAVTIHAAYEYHEEHTKGSLEVGKKADMIILEQSPLEIPKENIKNIKVLETIKEGITVYRR